MDTQHLRLLPPHPITAAALDRLATGASSQEEAAQVVRHLLAGCAECGRHLAAAQGYLPQGTHYDDRIFERSLARALERFERVAGG